MDTNKDRAKFFSTTSSPRKLVTVTYRAPAEKNKPAGILIKTADASSTPINFRQSSTQCGDDLEISVQALVKDTGDGICLFNFWPDDLGAAFHHLLHERGEELFGVDEHDHE